ncbi:lactonase family protein [Pelagicoccus sp. SDUM812002]|uniref:lactonase family protein n=1 Tax=Pelagicoccus sp. SDUM812002 TaxID=3041266 RepID=UPI00280DB4EB|nr:lactonase family protein [Pelagicoccus sp. SDUM812002]MDQ8188127.1 lactonase family protein [Pelagicoccus sp. SDUM812002]
MKTFVYFGTKPVEHSKGIYCYSLDLETGAMALVDTTTAVNCAFLSVHPSKRVLYTLANVAGAEKGQNGGLAAYRINPETGALAHINTVSCPTVSPSHVQVDRIGANVFGANYNSSFVVTYPVRADGGLAEYSDIKRYEGNGPNEKRQEAPHPHSVFTSPDNRFALVSDLGTDTVHVYENDTLNHKLVSTKFGHVNTTPGAGPRHLAFHPCGRFVYVLNEMASTLGVYNYDSATGALSEVQVIDTLPSDYDEIRWAAEVLVSPDGRFVYSSNRGHESIAIFSVDPASGKLTAVGHESTRGVQPRNFNIDPTGRWLIAANMDSDNCELFRIDPVSGNLSHTSSLAIPACARVAFL